MLRAIFIPSILAFAPLQAQQIQPPVALQNATFTEGGPGQVPVGWRTEARGGAVVEQLSAISGQDRPCAVIRVLPEHPAGTPANLFQTLDAAPFRGKRVRLSAFLKRSGGGTGTGHLFLRVDLPGRKRGFYDNMGDRPFFAKEWTRVEIVGDVALGAEKLYLGAMLEKGDGSLAIADVQLETLGDAPVGTAWALDPAGAANLVAFAKAYGYVRFFHPSDQAATAPWDELALRGVQAVEGASGSRDLARRLQTFFEPYAPTARFLVAGQAPQPPPKPPGAVFGVRWIHAGVGLGNPGPYSSQRAYAPLGPKVQPGGDPQHAPCFELGGGVRLQMPLACYANRDRHTLPLRPALPESASIPALPKPTGPYASQGDPADRTTRLAAVVEIWNVIQHFYPNFDRVDLDWPALLPTTLGQVAESPSPEAYLRTIQCLMARLKDGHGHVRPLWADPEGPPGLALTWVGPDLVVCGVDKDLASSIQRGDLLLSVEGEPLAKRVADLAPTLPASSPQGLRYLEAEFLLRGPAGPLNLVVRGPDGQERAVRVRRPSRASIPREPRPEALTQELKPGIWYLDLGRLDVPSVDGALQAVAQARAIILDMRGYPVFGAWQKLFCHFTDSALQTPAFLTPTPAAPDRKDMAYHRNIWVIEPEAPKLGAKLFFLVDARAISQAELLMDFVEYYHLGAIIGEATAGVDGNVNPFKVGGLSVSWTGMRVRKHDGTPLDGVGTLPTVPVVRTLAGIREGRDEILEKALALALQVP